MAKQANLRDIAKAAGVSLQTVSRVVRGVDVVAEATRERVMRAVVELNYQPNLAARSLSARRTGSVHVINAVPLFHGHAMAFVAICQELAALGMHISTSVVPLGQSEPPEARELMPISADGIVILGGRTVPSPWLGQVVTQAPTVLVGRVQDLPGQAVGVAVEQVGGAKRAVRHLVERGCRRVAHVAGPMDWVDARLRLDGYRSVCEETGMEPLVLSADSWDAHAALPHMASLPATVDGVFAGNDQLALGCMTELQRLGRRVPGDVKVVGFDDATGADCFLPPLTTMCQPFLQVGEQAVATLNVLLGGGAAESTIIEPALIVRAST